MYYTAFCLFFRKPCHQIGLAGLICGCPGAALTPVQVGFLARSRNLFGGHAAHQGRPSQAVLGGIVKKARSEPYRPLRAPWTRLPGAMPRVTWGYGYRPKALCVPGSRA